MGLSMRIRYSHPFPSILALINLIINFSDLPPDDASSIAESEPQSLVAGGSSSVGGVDEEWEGSDISLTQDSEYNNEVRIGTGSS